MKLSVCAETVFTDRVLPGRLEGIKRHGISAYELWILESHDLGAVQHNVQADGFDLLLYCGNRNHALINPAHREGVLGEFRQSVERAQKLNCRFLAALSDVVDEKGIPIPPDPPLSETQRITSMYEGLSQLLEMIEGTDITLLIEPLNTKVDHPGYTVRYSDFGFEMIRALGSPRIKMLYDIYHLQVMEGNIIDTIESNLGDIGHIHVADVPGRHESGTGELNYANIARMLQANNYDGYVGLECFPAGDSDAALKAFTDIFG